MLQTFKVDSWGSTLTNGATAGMMGAPNRQIRRRLTTPGLDAENAQLGTEPAVLTITACRLKRIRHLLCYASCCTFILLSSFHDRDLSTRIVSQTRPRLKVRMRLITLG
jgi:hypothetical protein